MIRLAYLFCLLICISRDSFSQTTSQNILENFTAAFNQRKAETMMQFVSDSIVWSSISGDTLTVELKGKAALEQWLRGYFYQCPSCRSELISIQTAGRFVSVYEKASWQGKNGERSQKSLAVYEISNEKIQRVLYFPSER